VVLFLICKGSRSPEERGQNDREENRGNKVFVGNLSFKTSWQKLKDYMRDAGEVLRVKIFEDHHGRSKGCGYDLQSNNKVI
jgi:RNA recognition motif-containing protein